MTQPQLTPDPGHGGRDRAFFPLAMPRPVPSAAEEAAPEAAPSTSMHSADDSWLMGSVFRHFQIQKNLTDRQLAEYLGMPLDRMRWLGMRTRPVPDSPAFDREVERLARAFRCDPDLLTDLLNT